MLVQDHSLLRVQRAEMKVVWSLECDLCARVMHVCVYVCISVRMCVRVHKCADVCAYVCMCDACVCVRVHKCADVCACA